MAFSLDVIAVNNCHIGGYLKTDFVEGWVFSNYVMST